VNYVVCHPTTNRGDVKPWSRGDVVSDAQLFPGFSEEDRAPLIARLESLMAITPSTLVVDGVTIDPNA
jgi:hypothetical protein